MLIYCIKLDHALYSINYGSHVNHGPEPCQSGTALTFPVDVHLCLRCTGPLSCLSNCVPMYSCSAVRAYVHDDHALPYAFKI